MIFVTLYHYNRCAEVPLPLRDILFPETQLNGAKDWASSFRAEAKSRKATMSDYRAGSLESASVRLDTKVQSCNDPGRV